MNRRALPSWVVLVTVILSAALITATNGTAAQSSQPPAPSEGKRESKPPQSEPTPNQAKPAVDVRGTEQSPAIVRVTKSKDQSGQDERDRQDEVASKRLTLLLTGLTLLTLIIQSFVLWRQNSIMERQSTIMAGQLTATGISADAAKMSADAARDAVNAAREQRDVLARQSTILSEQSGTLGATLATSREIERAYITFGHRNVKIVYSQISDGDGGWIVEHDKPKSMDVTIAMTNRGRTPGDVLGGFIGYRIGAEPDIPDVTRALKRFDVGFLLPGKGWSIETAVQEDNIARFAAVLKGEGDKRFWLIGEIDYEDRFGGLHTCGYGRLLIANYPNHPTLEMSPSVGKFNFDVPMNTGKRNHYGKS